MRPASAWKPLVAVSTLVVGTIVPIGVNGATQGSQSQSASASVVCTAGFVPTTVNFGAGTRSTTWTAPLHMGPVFFDLLGAVGEGNGGAGGEASAAITVPNGETLQINVGDPGFHTNIFADPSFNGGGGSQGGNSGGGATDVRRDPLKIFPLSKRVLVAGGGGGAGNGPRLGPNGGYGGSGGGVAGGDGGGPFVPVTPRDAKGATATGGGAGGIGSSIGTFGGKGVFGVGGEGGYRQLKGANSSGGGGGGGWYGGGGGAAGPFNDTTRNDGAGGGGSGYGPAGAVLTAGVNGALTGARATITYCEPKKPDTPATTNCTATVQETVGDMALSSGTTCFDGADIEGNIILSNGAALSLRDSYVSGSINTVDAAAVTMCSSYVVGRVHVYRSTGFVLIGDGGDNGGSTPCAGNTFESYVDLIQNKGGLSNTGGVEFGGNTALQGVNVVANKGGTLTEDDATEIEGNNISGRLFCGNNIPYPTNDGRPNSAGTLNCRV